MKKRNLKIAFLVGNFPALSATFILNQITGLLDRGCEVKIYALRNPEEKRMHPDVGRYDLTEKIRYFAVPENRLKRLAGALRMACRNFRTHPRRIIKCFNPFFFPRETLRLNTPYYLEPLLNEKPDILLCHFGPNGMLGALLRGLGVPGKVVTIFHGYDLSSFLNRHSVHVYRTLFNTGDMFLPVSEFWQQRLTELGCPQKKTRVLHMGIDVTRFGYFNRPGHYARKIRLLSVGRLVEKKGHTHVLRALTQLSGRIDFHYTVAGDGPLQTALAQQTAHSDLTDRVSFCGPVTADEVTELYQKNDVFVLPSITGTDGDCEGIPMVLMEAMATGMPVISTFHSGIPELVENHVTGFLVAERDAAALAERIACLAANPGLCKKMGLAGQKKVKRSFNLRIQNNTLFEWLSTLGAKEARR